MCSPSVEAKEEVVAQLRQKIENEKTTLPEKYRCLFSLRNLRNDSAHDALIRALQDESALFRHDVAFCLGQRQDEKAVKVLCDILADAEENPMVRHEAAEALGAIATPECLKPLQHHHDDPVQEVAETCQLALQRLEFLEHHPGGSASADGLRTDENPYNSVDPTPALPKCTPLTTLQELALDEAARMFDRYTAMFALRNIGSREAIEALGRMFTSRSALLKHEVAYVMGQIQSPHAVDVLTKVLQDQSEHAMVRHEAAEALGSIADPACQGVLRDYCSDPEPIVAHSCVVALDVMDHESSGQLEYASCAS